MVLRDGIGKFMSEELNTRSLLEQAERAAIAGDFASADELLKNAARIQEAELGPLRMNSALGNGFGAATFTAPSMSSRSISHRAAETKSS